VLRRAGLCAALIPPAAWLGCATALALLNGCATVPREVPAAAPPAVQAPSAKQPAPLAQAPRRGGYYQDDGPDDNPPPDLDTIADAEPRLEPPHRFANNPYNVFGQSYVPLRTRSAFRQRGVGSWYGRKFHGQRTSSGEIYDMYAMTAAHPTLPIPSYARVTHLASGRSVVVRINDRGPFHAGRIIDLSYTAAWKLGYVASGSALVEVVAITPAEMAPLGSETVARATPAAGAAAPVAEAKPIAQTPAAEQTPLPPLPETIAGPGGVQSSSQPAGWSQPSGNIYVQLAAFSVRESAERVRMRLNRDLAWLGGTIEIFSKDGLFRLHLGPYRDRGEASGAAERIQDVLQTTKPLLVVR